ncbi:hypothetical protein [Brevundimonas vesicularis]|uniref:hypothetical protein n=1 Tax=Brevundimonas vesicularis TaxID=41276 RepID=UPI00384AF221
MADDNNTPPVDEDSRPDDVAEKLKANNAKLLKEAAEARKRAAEAEAKIAEREEADARAAEEQEKAKGEFAKVEGRLTAERDDWKAKYENLVGTNALTTALIEAKVDDIYKPAVTALLKEKGIKITKDGEPQIEGRSLTDYVKEWAASDAGKPFILDGNSGGGAPGGGSPGVKPLSELGEAERLALARKGKLRPLTGA